MVGVLNKRLPTAKCVVTVGAVTAMPEVKRRKGERHGRLERAIRDHNFAKQVSKLSWAIEIWKLMNRFK